MESLLVAVLAVLLVAAPLAAQTVVDVKGVSADGRTLVTAKVAITTHVKPVVSGKPVVKAPTKKTAPAPKPAPAAAPFTRDELIAMFKFKEAQKEAQSAPAPTQPDLNKLQQAADLNLIESRDINRRLEVELGELRAELKAATTAAQVPQTVTAPATPTPNPIPVARRSGCRRKTAPFLLSKDGVGGESSPTPPRSWERHSDSSG